MPHSKPKPNALSHGLYSNCIVLDGENPQEFSDMLEGFRTDFAPQGISEEATVLELASLHWKKGRLEAGLQQALNMQRASSVSDASDGGWDRVVDDHTRAMAKFQMKAVEGASEMICKQLERIFKPDEAKDSKAIEYEKLAVLAKQVDTASKQIVVPILQIVEKQKRDQIERACNPDIMERTLKVQAELDRRIEKTLKRLVMIKEFKRLYVPKSVDSKPAQIEVLPTKPVGGETGIEVDAGAPVIT